MLRTRLWVGSILIALFLGMLVGDQYLSPWYPILFIFQITFVMFGAKELIDLAGPDRISHSPIAYVGVGCLAIANWVVHLVPMPGLSVWGVLAGILTGFLLLDFLYEMARYAAPGRSVERLASSWFVLGYLGWLPCYFAQLRWLHPFDSNQEVSDALVRNSIGLALAVCVPKACDIGAYFSGRLFGRHPMSSIISPKKTMEGAVGGLVLAVLSTIAIDRGFKTHVLHENIFLELGFGLSVGLAGMLGDLAESLLKRDCNKKDASQNIPGFGGVLDLVDALLFAAPVTYLWLTLVK